MGTAQMPSTDYYEGRPVETGDAPLQKMYSLFAWLTRIGIKNLNTHKLKKELNILKNGQIYGPQC